MIKAIVLDIGGVVLRTEDPSFRRQLDTQHGLPAGTVDRLVFNSPQAHASTIGKEPTEEIWRNVAETLGVPPSELAQFQEEFWKGDQVDQLLITYLQSLRPKYATAFLSNAWLGARQTLAEVYGLVEGEIVDRILISSELGVAKPNYQIFDILRQALGCQYPEILFVDDFIENIEAARALRMVTIHYHAGVSLINQIKSMLS